MYRIIKIDSPKSVYSFFREIPTEKRLRSLLVDRYKFREDVFWLLFCHLSKQLPDNIQIVLAKPKWS